MEEEEEEEGEEEEEEEGEEGCLTAADRPTDRPQQHLQGAQCRLENTAMSCGLHIGTSTSTHIIHVQPNPPILCY